MKPKFTIKQILTSDHNWWNFYEKYKAKLRTAILVCIIKLLSCKNNIRGYKEYHCQNTNCTHTKRIYLTCKSKACSSCGKKATELWIEKQNQILPNTSWQHITFTLPSELWDFFWYNRQLLQFIGALAANCIQTLAKKKKIIVGIFIAIHTFGRDLKRNVHIHLSVTTGGLSENLQQWKNLFFHQETLMKMWRYQIISLFRNEYKNKKLILPTPLQKQLNPTFTFNQFLQNLYKKHWVVHCSKPSTDYKYNVNYLARYTKRPAIAESKLKHYDGYEVTFNYLDHTTKTYRHFTLTAEQFIARFIQHIPDEGFRMIRYYGFLANRIRGKLLPIVYQLLGQENRNTTSSTITFATLMQKSFNLNPFICILCGQQLILASTHFGKFTANELLPFHKQLALLQKI